ncbi:hypothetical protein WI40_14090 [Burkholderia ubonensis]|uniref:hypothetical protein n=1 Tax=Burkholderia ubonensis TaxID=101571 RepID=UPI00075A0873|nr:hypothetical protein [Burkholderia ubonensis]KUZ98129.1 hypothetical protein WI40_14090 [Burkholderia ubonensis]
MSAHRPNHDEILATFQPGKVYEATAVAAKFKQRASELKPTLEELVANGRLKRGIRRHGSRISPGYTLPTGAEADPRAIGTTIAGPQYARNWKSTLTGYDREMRTRAELCMAARTR